MRRIRLAPLAAVALIVACGPPPPPDDGYRRAHPDLATGTGFVRVGTQEIALGAVHVWTPYSFADREGLAALLRTGVDPAPVDANRNLTFRRHRTYPLAAWAGGAGRGARVRAVYATGDDRRTHGSVTVEGDGTLRCAAEALGDAVGSGFLNGRCEDGREVRVVFRAWQVETAFALPDDVRARLGASLPDWERTASWCAARGGGPPWCGESALQPFGVSATGRQEREPGGGSWILTRDGKLLVVLAWRDGEELLLVDVPPPDGRQRRVAARSIVAAPELVSHESLRASTKTIALDFDGVVLMIDRGGANPRRVVPDALVVTGIAQNVLAMSPAGGT